MQVYNSFQEMAAGQAGGAQSTMSVFNEDYIYGTVKYQNPQQWVKRIQQLDSAIGSLQDEMATASDVGGFPQLDDRFIDASRSLRKAINLVAGTVQYSSGDDFGQQTFDPGRDEASAEKEYEYRRKRDELRSQYNR